MSTCPLLLRYSFHEMTNYSRLTNLRRLSHVVFYVLRGPRLQDAGTPLLSSALTLESDPGPGKGLHDQSNLHWSLHRPWPLQFFCAIIQCNCSACNVPLDLGLQKNTNLSALIVGLAEPRTRTTCVAHSGANRSDIHYDFQGLHLLNANKRT
jgi:hypothetical protein